MHDDVMIAFRLIPWQDVLTTINFVLAIIGIILAIYLGFGGKSISLTVCLVVVPIMVTLGWYGGNTWTQTDAGRKAAASVASWNVVADANFESGQAPSPSQPNEFGQTTARIKDGRLGKRNELTYSVCGVMV
jgi:hypothetical protein